MNKKVAIIIVTWNGMKWIERCLTSVRRSKFPAHVFLVDNKSADGTPEFIKKKYTEVTIICSKENLGFGKANNIAIKQAYEQGYDYFFLLNQDAYLLPDTIGRLLETASTGKFAIISPVHLNGKATDVDPYFRDFVLAKCPGYLKESVLHEGKALFESDFIPAAAWFVPRSTIDEIGGFDPLFYHYGEDDNYCQRCLYHKRKIVFTTNAFIRHDRFATVGNKQMYNYKLFYRHLLQDSANILYGKGYIIQKLGRQFYDETGLFLMYLMTGKWNALHNFVGDYCRILFNLRRIRNSRRENKLLHGLTIK